MNWSLRNAPIRIKLILIIVLVATVVLTIGVAQFMVFDFLSFRSNTIEKLTTVARIVSINSTSAILFKDKPAGEQSLSALKAERSVLVAVILDERGRPFARYQSNQKYVSEEVEQLTDHWKLHPQAIMKLDNWSLFEWSHVDVSVPVLFEEDVIGTVYIISTTDALFTRLWNFLLIVLMVTVLSFTVVVVLSTRLQRFITVPIHRLLKAMKKVSESEDYNIHVKRTNEDELGRLIDGFNSMLDEVRKRDELLKKHRQDLEGTVNSRTEQLTRANKNLQRAISDLRIAKDAAEAANTAKSNFLASMSHELRTPLNAVIGFSEVLIDSHFGEINEKQEEYLMDIMASGQHLLALITDILDISKIESGRDELEKGPVNIREIIDNSLVMIKERAHRHGLILEASIDQKVEDLPITADARKVKQVLFNLLTNAAKFTPDGGRIKVVVESSGDELAVSVTDSGTGIREDELEKIFEEFYQTEGGLANKTPGTGLGLALSRKFIQMHGGRIWAQSDGEGKGSQFIFTLPLEEAGNSATSSGGDR